MSYHCLAPSQKSKTAGLRLWLGRIIPPAVGLGIWLVPARSGISEKAWHLLALFLATILGFMLKPLPMGAVAVIAIAATALTGTLAIEQ